MPGFSSSGGQGNASLCTYLGSLLVEDKESHLCTYLDSLRVEDMEMALSVRTWSLC